MTPLLDLLRQVISSVIYRGPEGAKRLELRSIHSRLRACRPPLFRQRGALLLPGLATRLLLLARSLEPLRALFRQTLSHEDREAAQRYHDLLLESRLPPNPDARRISFTYNEMKRLFSSGVAADKVFSQVDARFDAYMSGFGGVAYAGFDATMTDTLRLASLARLDLDTLLRRFDPRFDSARADSAPDFGEVPGSEIQDSLLDLYFLIAPLRITDAVVQNIDTLAARLQRDRHVREPGAITAAVDRVRAALRDAVPPDLLLDLLRAVQRDPGLVPKTDSGGGDYVADFTRRVGEQYTRDRERLARELERAALEADVKALFEGGALLELKGYSDEENAMLLRRDMDGFDLVFPLRVLKSFAVARYENRLMDTVKRLLVAGAFSDRVFQQSLSAAALACETVSARIEELEAGFDEGARFPLRVIHRSMDEHRIGKAAVSAQLRRIIRSINREARVVLEECGGAYYQLATLLRQAVDDSRARSPDKISNIRVIAGERNAQFIASLIEGYGDIRRLLQIVRRFAVPQTGASVEGRRGAPGRFEPGRSRRRRIGISGSRLSRGRGHQPVGPCCAWVRRPECGPPPCVWPRPRGPRRG